jgi:hypothetical protein
MPQSAVLRPGPSDFHRPPWVTMGDGRARAVGVELEFIGPNAEATARALAAEFGGAVAERDPHSFAVEGSRLGHIGVELDTRYAHPDKIDPAVLGGFGPTLASWIGTAASYFLPCEVVTAPIPVDRLHEVDGIVDVLRGLGAKGTQDGALYAFGLHLNVEAPRLDAPTIGAVLKAFVLLNGWLRRQVAPDATRSFLGFAEPFPEPYVRRLAAADYAPSLTQLMDDYLASNPTRNRDLDLLPLFLFLDEARVRAVLPNQKINGRPAFHYRLPDSRVSDPGWSIAPEWNRWVAVERLAADPERLEMVGLAYLEFPGEAKSWADVVERIALA